MRTVASGKSASSAGVAARTRSGCEPASSEGRLLDLQRTAGNAAVASLLAPRSTLAVQRLVADGGEDLQAATARLNRDKDQKGPSRQAALRLNLVWKQLYGKSNSSAMSQIGSTSDRKKTGMRILGTFDQVKAATDLYPELGTAPPEVIKLMEAVPFEKPIIEQLMGSDLPEGVHSDSTFAFAARDLAGGNSALDTAPTPAEMRRERIDTKVVDNLNKEELDGLKPPDKLWVDTVHREDVVLIGDKHPANYVEWAKAGGTEGRVWIQERGGGIHGRGELMVQGAGPDRDQLVKGLRRVTGKTLRFHNQTSEYADKFQRGLSGARKGLGKLVKGIRNRLKG